MAKITKYLLVTGIISLTTACSTITTTVPANRFDTPEVSGGLLKGSFEFGLQGSHDLTIIQDTSINPPNTADPTFKRVNDDFYLGGAIGVIDRLDLQLKAPLSQRQMFQAKFQIAGDPVSVAKAGNTSLAVSAGISPHTTSGSNTHLFQNVSNASYNIDFLAYDAAVIGGYRLTNTVLIYASAFAYFNNYDGKLTQTLGGASTQEYTFDGKVKQRGGNLGVMLSANEMFLKLEGVYSSVIVNQLSGSDSTKRTYFGLSIGGNW